MMHVTKCSDLIGQNKLVCIFALLEGIFSKLIFFDYIVYKLPSCKIIQNILMAGRTIDVISLFLFLFFHCYTVTEKLGKNFCC